MTADPVSYLLIERGWEVVGADGERVGEVDEQLPELDADIFDGLTVDQGLTKRPRYVPRRGRSPGLDGDAAGLIGRFASIQPRQSSRHAEKAHVDGPVRDDRGCRHVRGPHRGVEDLACHDR